jgi:hypothetical protein
VSVALGVAAGMLAAAFVWWTAVRLFVRRAAKRLRADPRRIAQLERELLDAPEDWRGQYYEALQNAVRFTPLTDAPGAVVRYRGDNPFARAAVLKDAWQPVVPRSPFYKDASGGTYVVNEDATGVWHEHADGLRVFVSRRELEL